MAGKGIKIAESVEAQAFALRRIREALSDGLQQEDLSVIEAECDAIEGELPTYIDVEHDLRAIQRIAHSGRQEVYRDKHFCAREAQLGRLRAPRGQPQQAKAPSSVQLNGAVVDAQTQTG